LSKTIRALIKTPQEFKAVWLRPAGEGYELLGRCDKEQELPPADTTVVGFDSGRVSFYRINIPPVKDEQINNLVNMQAETLMPLPMEQMDIAWRRGASGEGKIPVTITAVRSIQLEKSFQGIQAFRPSRIFLDCEAVVKAWQEFYAGGNQKAVIIYTGAFSSRVCLVQNGRLSHAATLDVGREELLTSPPLGTSNLQRLSHDLYNCLQLFDVELPPQLPIYLLCPDMQSFQPIVKHLVQTELKVQTAIPNKDSLTASEPLSAQTFYENLVPIGLALMELDSDRDELKLFRRIMPEKDPHEKKYSLPSLKLSAALAGVMLIAFVVSSYAYMLEMEKSLNDLPDPNIDMRQLQLEQKIKKTISQDRINLLDMINVISSSAPRGVQLDKFIYQKDRPVSVEAHTSRQELIRIFQAELSNQAIFKSVIIQNQNLNTRNNQVTFTVKFEYQNPSLIR